jgi:putative ABC transport system ATP-binding protein
MTSPILEGRSLCKSYDEGRIEALRGVDISIAAGEYIAITGPSGSGKSTLLHLLGGLDNPTSGTVLFRNARLDADVDLDTYRSGSVGFIFQAFHLMPTLRSIENVQVPMLALNRNGRDRAARAGELLKEMGLEQRMRQYPNQLSAGERQRVAIARALANDPEVLLADEPTGNLDTKSSDAVLHMLLRSNQELGQTTLMITHNPEAASIASRILYMRDGEIVREEKGSRPGFAVPAASVAVPFTGPATAAV